MTKIHEPFSLKYLTHTHRGKHPESNALKSDDKRFKVLGHFPGDCLVAHRNIAKYTRGSKSQPVTLSP